ncbi:ethanolamine ammonia-lyase subunit EutB [Hungatella sp.]|uniref:ethanolamine ammonia-lyase subunit EutB n=1 Tax=Hungatella sp. TaxID=2613924 RepID=UPI00399326FB
MRKYLKRFDEVKHQFDIPTQICVLGHITTQIEAVKQGAPCDMIFQSIAGSEKETGLSVFLRRPWMRRRS